MPQTRFTIIRHGETEWNVQGREMGQLDSPLTPTGIAQARQLARRLASARFDAIYSSDLGRAVATVTVMAEGRPLKVMLDPRLRERHMGIFQSLTFAEMRERYPGEWADFEQRGIDYVIPGGESARQRLERTMACLNELADKHPDGSVLVVTHGGILAGLFQHVLGIPSGPGRTFRRLNAAINVFARENSRWILETWGDIAHLENLSARDDPGKAG